MLLALMLSPFPLLVGMDMGKLVHLKTALSNLAKQTSTNAERYGVPGLGQTQGFQNQLWLDMHAE